jgi:uncharacterized protein (DUF433 family)
VTDDRAGLGLAPPVGELERPVRMLRPLPFSVEHGIYLQAEAALLAGLRRTTVRRWTQLERGADSLTAVAEQPLLSFLDLVSLRAVAALRRAGLSLQKIKKGRDYMRAELGMEYPLASKNLLTDGVHLYFSVEDKLLAVNRGGQWTAEQLVRDYLCDVKYELVGRGYRLATSWEPPGISIDPLRQRGAPCIAGSRVQVAMLHRYVNAGDSPEHLANVFELDLDALKQGLQWYEGLRQQVA